MILIMGPRILVRKQNLVLIPDFLDSNQKLEFEITRSRTELRLCWGLCLNVDSCTLLWVGARKAGY
jgi:hypothetical protein